MHTVPVKRNFFLYLFDAYVVLMPMEWSEDATAVFADISLDAEGNGGHGRTSAQETVAMLCPATVPDHLLSENAVVTEKVPTLELQVPALQLQVSALQFQATALYAAGERHTRIEKGIAEIDQVSM